MALFFLFSLMQSMSLRRLGRTLQLRRQLSQAKKQGEFAREMMMLPLSLKNPDLGGSMPEPSPDCKLHEYCFAAH